MTVPYFYFTNNGLHTHLVFPTQQIKDLVPSLKPYFLDTTWLQIGWGDYQYYGNPEQTNWMGAKALFLPTAAVIGMLGINTIPEDIPKNTAFYKISLDTMHWNAILGFICAHFKTDAANQIAMIRAKPTGEMFFAAHGTYSIFNTCNHWTAKALATAGLSMKPSRSFSPNYIEKSVIAHNGKMVTE